MNIFDAPTTVVKSMLTSIFSTEPRAISEEDMNVNNSQCSNPVAEWKKSRQEPQ